MNRTGLFLGATVAVSACVMACGDKKPTTLPPTPMAMYEAGPPDYGYDAGAAPTQAPAADGWSGTAQRMDPSMAAAATGFLAQVAGTEAPGMQPEGVIGAGNFQQGQTLESTFQMMPGKCYTVVAVGAGIQQLDIQMVLVTLLPGFAPQFGENNKKTTPLGSQSVLGAKTNCMKLTVWPTPVLVKFVVTAARGQGLAAAQLYSK